MRVQPLVRDATISAASGADALLMDNGRQAAAISRSI